MTKETSHIRLCHVCHGENGRFHSWLIAKEARTAECGNIAYRISLLNLL